MRRMPGKKVFGYNVGGLDLFVCLVGSHNSMVRFTHSTKLRHLNWIIRVWVDFTHSLFWTKLRHLNWKSVCLGCPRLEVGNHQCLGGFCRFPRLKSEIIRVWVDFADFPDWKSEIIRVWVDFADFPFGWILPISEIRNVWVELVGFHSRKLQWKTARRQVED